MANPEHVEILKKSVVVWNDWREKNRKIDPDLSGEHLVGISLIHANLVNANLRNTNFHFAHLDHADFTNADLSGAYLTATTLTNAFFIGSNLSNVNFDMASIGWTMFCNVDLSVTKGLDSAWHVSPSSVGIDTLYISKGNIPEPFLRGCGFSDWQIENIKLFQPELSNEEITNILYRVHDLRANQAIQINPLFISYSHRDNSFVDKIEKYLNEKGIRFWRDIHHATAGRLETQVDRAIRLNPTVLLVLSSHSIESDWVQHEARLARRLELETGRDVLCPIALDDSWKDCSWPERLREQIMEYNILDFSAWNNDDSLQHMFNRLLKGLDLFYK
jgi:hypothetical protein